MQEIIDTLLKESRENIQKVVTPKDSEYLEDFDYFDSGIHASSVSYCKKKAVYQYLKLPRKPWTLEELVTFKLANYTHRLVIELFKKLPSFELLDSEIDVTEGMPGVIRGRYDWRVRYIPNGVIILGDTKSAHPGQFKYQRDTLPKGFHTNQLSMYADACDVLEKGYTKLAIWYWDRGGTNPSEFCFVDKNQRIKVIMSECLNGLYQYKESEEFPRVELKESPFDSNPEKFCDYCEFHEISCEGYDR